MDWKIGIFVTLLGVFIGFVFSLIASYHIERHKGRNAFNILLADMYYNIIHLLKIRISMQQFFYPVGMISYLEKQLVPKWRNTFIDHNLIALSFVCSIDELRKFSKIAIEFDELNAIHSELKQNYPDENLRKIYLKEWLLKSDYLINFEVPKQKTVKKLWL